MVMICAMMMTYAMQIIYAMMMIFAMAVMTDQWSEQQRSCKLSLAKKQAHYLLKRVVHVPAGNRPV